MTETHPPDPFEPTRSGAAPQGPGPWRPEAQNTSGTHEMEFGPAPKRANARRALLVGGLVGAVVLVGAGGTYAWTALASKGGQPAEVIPSTAIGYVRFDLDPSAGQKIAATRFLGKLPKLKTEGQDIDVKQTLWTWIAGSQKKLQGLNYDTDVKPWLGDRAALAVMPGGTSAKPNIVLALQVTDEARARDGISKITTASGQDDVEVTTKDGFAVITRKGAGSSLLSDLGKGSLAANPTFSGDMSALGDQGIASMWFDGKGFGEFAKNMGSASAGIDTAQLDGIGRAAVALRFNADYVELAGIGRGSKNLPDTPPMTGGAAALPDTTMLAWQSNGLGDAFGKAWPQLQKTIAGTRAGSDTLSGIEGQFGIKLPDDLQVLLGKSLTLSVPEQDFSKIGQSELPTIGARIVTTDAKRADEIVQGLVERGGVDNFVKRKVDGDKLFLATTDDYLGAIQQDGRLGATDAYKKAVADGDRATTAIFVNLDKLEPTYLKSVPGDYQEFVTSLSALGVSGTVGANGDSTFAMRLVGN